MEKKIQSLLGPQTTVALDTQSAPLPQGLDDISLLSGGLESQRVGLVVLRLESGTNGVSGFHPVAEGIVDTIRGALRTGDLLILVLASRSSSPYFPIWILQPFTLPLYGYKTRSQEPFPGIR